MNLLSLDGGGVRGVLQAKLLQRLENRHAFLDKIDRFAGSSIGTINAAWLALGRPLDTLIDLYRKAAPIIFAKSGSSIGFFAKTALRSQLRAHLGDVRLRDLQRPLLAGAVGAKGAHFWNPFSSPDRDEFLVDIILAATAAVPFLPPHKGFVDGGALAPDPAAVALAWVEPEGLDGVHMLSVGTGEAPHVPGGVLRAVLSAVSAGQRAVTETACMTRLGNRYHRVQPQLPRAIDLNDSDAIDELVRTATLWDEALTVRWLKATF